MCSATAIAIADETSSAGRDDCKFHYTADSESSSSGSFFELQAKHDVELSEQEPASIFHGNTSLSSNTNSSYLRAGVEQRGSPLYSKQRRGKGQYQLDLILLNPLFGRAGKEAEVRRSMQVLTAEISRRQVSGHVELAGGKAKPDLVLVPLKPRSSPEIGRAAEAEVHRRKENLGVEMGLGKPSIEAGSSPARPPLNAESVREHGIDISDVPIRKQDAGIDLSLTKPRGEGQILRRKRVADTGISPSRPQMESQAILRKTPLNADQSPTRRALVPEVLAAKPPIEVPLRQPDPRVDTELARGKRSTGTEILVAKPQTGVDLIVETEKVCTDISRVAKPQLGVDLIVPERKTDVETSRVKPSETEIALAKPQIGLELVVPKPAKDAELARREGQNSGTSMVPVGSAQLDTNAHLVRRKGSSVNVISWDQWYAGINEQSKPLLVQALEKHGNPGGTNTISITIWSNRQLEVKVARVSNSDFDAATLEAFKSLAGSSTLEFPTGSRRGKVSFFIDNSRIGGEVVTAVNSQSIVGDEEIQQSK
jgi:hypothetical protein